MESALYERNIKKRRLKDLGRSIGNWISGLFALAVLLWIVIYVFVEGSSYLSWDFLTGDYYPKNYTYQTPTGFVLSNYNGGKPFEDSYQGEGSSFSSAYGVSLALKKDLKQQDVVYIAHLEENSPFLDLVDASGKTYEEGISLYMESFIGLKEDGSYLIVSGKEGPEGVAKALDMSLSIHDLTLSSFGGGIRGSLLTTLSLTGLTLLFALPLGIGAAIHLALYAKKGGRLTNAIRTLIDVTSGVPSIIFGLAGSLIFIPFASTINGTSGGSLLSGALTLTVMLLPTVVKTTEEAIKALPESYLSSSLALGASKTQSVFKLILPNALPGILTSALLSIGRIIGESAALVFAMGAVIGESASWSSGYSTLAVHIWNVLSGESPAYGQAAAISIIIILVVLFLNILVKILAYRLKKKGGKA